MKRKPEKKVQLVVGRTTLTILLFLTWIVLMSIGVTVIDCFGQMYVKRVVTVIGFLLTLCNLTFFKIAEKM